MGLNGVIDDFKIGTYAVTRRSAGSYVDGRWVPGATSLVNIELNVQPMGGKELQVLPESFHNRALRKVYSKSALQTVSEGDAGIAADRISMDSEDWDVISVEHWRSSLPGSDYYKAVIAKVIT